MRSGPKLSTIALLILELLLCLLIYFACLCLRRRRARRSNTSAVLPQRISDDMSGSHLTCPGPGLEPVLIVFFPYSVLKGLSPDPGKPLCSLQCAACLHEFKDGGRGGDDQTLRLITKCCHVFHPECVDPCAVTCPCCWAGQGLDIGPNDGEGEGEDVVVEIEEHMVRLPEEVRKKITVHGKLVLPRLEPTEPCSRIGYR